MPTTETKATETATKPVRGFPGLCCPKCGTENTVMLHLDYLEAFWCTDCNEEWGAREVREMVERWSSVLAWLELAPVVLK